MENNNLNPTPETKQESVAKKNDMPEPAKKDSADHKNFFKSTSFWVVSAVVGGLIIIFLVFQIGMNIGFKKADFSRQWEENYHTNFAGPKNGFFGNFGDEEFIASHGVFGQIIKIDGQTVVINGSDKTEKIVLIKDDTVIRRLRDTLKPADLKVNDFIVVIGQPNDAGQIEAKLIRLMPPPPSDNNSLPPQPNIPLPPTLH